MNNTQSIIVYRNPAEAALWESGMVFNLIVFMILAVILCAIAVKVLDRFSTRISRPWGSSYRGARSNSVVIYTVLGACIAVAGYVAFGVLAI